MSEKKPIHKHEHAWMRWSKRYRTFIFLNVGIGLGMIFGPFIMAVEKQVFLNIQERLKTPEEIEKEEGEEQKSKLEEKKKELEEQRRTARAVLNLFTIANQILLDREKICHEIKDPDEQYSKLRILSDELSKNNRKIPRAGHSFSEIFNEDILHEARKVASLVQQAELGFPFCERNKNITSTLVQKKRLMLSENLRQFFLEKEKQLTTVTKNE